MANVRFLEYLKGRQRESKPNDTQSLRDATDLPFSSGSLYEQLNALREAGLVDEVGGTRGWELTVTGERLRFKQVKQCGLCREYHHAEDITECESCGEEFCANCGDNFIGLCFRCL